MCIMLHVCCLHSEDWFADTSCPVGEIVKDIPLASKSSIMVYLCMYACVCDISTMYWLLRIETQFCLMCIAIV